MSIKKGKIIDLRSDTVTLPTQEMLEAIKHAKLGDDVYQEDPTVNKLEELAACKMGKEAALLVTSGTQANLISVMANTKRGDEIILEGECHMYYYEVGSISAIGGVMPRPLKGKYGVLDPEDIIKTIRSPNIHTPPTTLICIENTHNRAGGTITAPQQIKAIHDVAQAHEINLYMDGARIFNAVIALEKNVKEFTKHIDSLMFCLSKGLSAPIGSVIVGDRAFIERARRIRKMLGGGMRQAGIIAAPGIIALKKMIDRLKKDHINARILAEGLAKMRKISINLEKVQTNIVLFDIGGLCTDANQFISKLNRYGVKALAREGTLVRMVTHRGICRENIEYTLNAVEEIMATSL